MSVKISNSSTMKVYSILLCILSVTSVAAQNIATIDGLNVNIDNGAVQAYIEGGRMKSINIKGGANLLNNGGFGYFSYNDDNGFFTPTNLQPQVKINNADIADIYFRKVDNFDIEMHFVFRKNESGFYTYFVVSDAGIPGKSLNQLRFAFRVDKDIFNYAWTVEREGPMIHPDTLANYVEEIQDATYLLQDGSIYTKYNWCAYKVRDRLHGLMGAGTGVWNMEASHEYISGGPTMQETTLHGTFTTPILLCPFLTGHFGSETITLRDEYSSWQKIFGPAFIYINSGTNEEIIADAKQKAEELENEWAYDWLNHELYPLNRGSLTGKLEMKGRGTVDSAMVVLCKSGPSWFGEDENWQWQPYDYFFWTEADEDGNFNMEMIRPGTYTLYAYTQKGKLIEELKLEDVPVEEGNNSIGVVQWDANDRQKTIFQIGAADHKSGEYKLGNLPRAYGRWKESPLELTYNVATDNPRENWYYCQRENTVWDIKFHISDLSVLASPVIKVALAGRDARPHLDVILNGETVSENNLGSDSGIRRSSLTSGKYRLITCDIDKNLLLEGDNTLSLHCYGSEQEYKGVMYDAILLEADTSESVHDPSLASLSVSKGELTPEFNYRRSSYAVSIPEGTVELPTVSAMATNENAIVEIENITAIPDTAYVRVTADDGISTAIYSVYFDYVSSVAETDYFEGVKVYPNPTDGIIEISADKDIENVTVFNLAGRVEHSLNNEFGKRSKLDVSNLHAGFYIIQIKTEKQSHCSRIFLK